MIETAQKRKILDAFRSGTLRTRSVSPEGQIEWKRVLVVNRAEVPWETIYEGETSKGPFVLTAGHRVFCNPDGSDKLTMKDIAESGTGTCMLGVASSEEKHGPLPAGCINPGHGILPWDEPSLGYRMLHTVGRLESRQFMYDMTVDGWHNFVLERSGIVVSNSPDRHYHFRPPEFEGEIGKYNRVFGQIWEDAELYEYLVSALDWFNMFPPFTGNTTNTIDRLVTDMPAWRTAIIWNAITQACFAMFANWVADEFSVAGKTLTRVHLPDGRVLDIPIEELWAICKGDLS